MENLIYIFIFLFGLVIGSFLNVCICRMPNNESVVRPRSHCAFCKKTIPWFDNIPILSFIFLRARCRFCGERISWRYPLVELLTALIFLAIIDKFGLNLYSIGLLAFAGGLIIATFIDIAIREIPDSISLGGIILAIILGYFTGMPKAEIDLPAGILVSALGAFFGMGLFLLILVFIFSIIIYFLEKNKKSVNQQTDDSQKENLLIYIVVLAGLIAGWNFFPQVLSFFYQNDMRLGGVFNALLGASLGASIIFATTIFGDILFFKIISFFYKKVLKRKFYLEEEFAEGEEKTTMGFGDVKFLGMIGAFLGYKLVLMTFFLAPFLGIFVGLYQKVRTQKSLIPYGPFLALAALILLFWGDRIINTVISWFSVNTYF